MTSKPGTVIVQDPETGEQQRMNLAGAIDLGIEERNWHQGIDLEGVYLMPRSRRVVLSLYSRWEDRRHPGRVMGQSYTVADNDQIASIAKEFDCEQLANLLPEFVDA